MTGVHAGNRLPTQRPLIDPETLPYWNAAAEGRLVVPYCTACQRSFWYPRGFCPACGGDAIEWRPSNGTGVVYSYTIINKAFGRWTAETPFAVGYVELDEGPRVLANLVGGDLGSIEVGMKVAATFDFVEATEDGPAVGVLRFTPV